MFEDYFIRILLAALVGGIIGIEREYHDKTAGFRTMILIATGSSLFTIMSLVIGTSIDPARVAAAVVSGVGFLGAGAVVKEGLNIRGLTTAASIWLVASLGMGMGAGQFALTGAVTSFISVIMWFLPFFERRIDKMHEFLEFTIVIKNTDKQEDKLMEVFAEEGIKTVSLHRTKISNSERELRIMAKNRPDKHDALGKRLASSKLVLRFRT
ncbi:MgtC/SapB family protein, partial [Candidatus Kaiserbacteria bacterium]|nr:MgtC/SapB family protein [Candidatus Kaiserbacteria bacterium]MCB9811361.1 MgtC/SapB family protein [Candidatus Nomurabacteria bacterium]